MKGENQSTFLEALLHTRHYHKVVALIPMLIFYRGYSSPQFANEGVEAQRGGHCIVQNHCCLSPERMLSPVTGQT